MAADRALMAVPVSELESLRDALIRARAAGVRSVETAEGRKLTYSTDAEMRSAIADLDRRIAGASAPSVLRFTTSKGT